MAQRTVFEERIRAELDGIGWSQPKFARKMDVAQQTVTGWVTGKWEPRMKQLAEMSQLLNVSMEYLAGVVDERVALSEIEALSERRAAKREKARAARDNT